MNFHYLFPGQGSQRPGMGADFYAGSPPARETLDEAAAVLGNGLLDTLFNGQQESLNDTRVAQAGLLAVGVAIARHLAAKGIAPAGCAGHSLGEITALVAAGALEFADALRITRERARLMSEDVPPGGMAAVIGLDAEAIEAALPEGAQVANLNGPGQTIISGTAAGIEAAAQALKAAGAKRVMPLKVSGPFHSRLMSGAAEGMRAVLAPISLKTPAVPFISSVSAREEQDPETIRELLWRQVVSPVRWTEVMTSLGPVAALEAGPGKVLQGIAKRMEQAPAIQLAGTLEETAALAL